MYNDKLTSKQEIMCWILAIMSAFCITYWLTYNTGDKNTKDNTASITETSEECCNTTEECCCCNTTEE